jgi:hypothetical protein
MFKSWTIDGDVGRMDANLGHVWCVQGWCIIMLTRI